MVGGKLTVPINKIHKRPTFSTLWHFQHQLVDGLRKVGNVKPPLDGQSGYILSKYAFSLFSSKWRRDPEEVGEYYKIPVTPITEMEQQTEENKWKVKKENRKTFENMKMVLTNMFKEVIDPAFHSGICGLARKGFVNTHPVEILSNHQRLYRKPS